jgi:hypothetical protein
MAADLFVVPSVTFRLLFVLVILAHDRRRIVHVAVTEHPTAQQLRNTFSENENAALSSPRSRFGLCRRGDHHRRHEYADGSNSAQIAVAERLRGTRHRLDPTRVPRSRHRGQRRRAPSSTHRVRHLLHAVTDTSDIGEGRADLAPGRAVVDRADRRDAARRRAPPPLRSRGSLVAVSRRPANDIPGRIVL